MIVETKEDLIGLKQIGKIAAQCLHEMQKYAKPGMTTKELDDFGAAFLKKHNARSAPILVYNFPGATCICVNEEIAHGIPGDKVLQPGDLINVDVSAELNGYYADTGASFVLPPVSKEKQRVCRFTRRALQQALHVAKADAPLRNIGSAVEKVAKEGDYKIIRNLGSHGVGKALHEAPKFIPSFYDPREKRILKEGLVITIEPFLSTKTAHANESDDGWTLLGPSGNLCAQFEHTIIITKDKPIILTNI